MKSSDEEMLNDLSSFIEQGEIQVFKNEIDEAFVTIKNHFPCSGSGIAWEKVKDFRYAESPDNSHMKKENVERLSEFLDQFAEEASITNTQILNVMGDDPESVVVLKMNLHILKKCLYPIFSFVRITCVTTENYEWCLEYNRFYDDMRYGKSPEWCGKQVSLLEHARKTAARTRNLPDGRIRYYQTERFAKNSSQTHTESFVTEWNPKNRTINQWLEDYDSAGNIIRVHPRKEGD